MEAARYSLSIHDEKYKIDLEFQPIESTKNKQITVDKGNIFFGNNTYVINNNWNGSFLNQDRLFYIAGKAENSNGKIIDVFVFGKFLSKTHHGSMYDIKVHIHPPNTIHIHPDGSTHIHTDLMIDFSSESEIIGILPKEVAIVKKEMPPVNMLFLIVDSHHRFQDEEYFFTTRIYDMAQNPFKDWNAKGGEISGANVSVQLLDLQSNILNQINGTTNKWGWFDGHLLLGSKFPQGEYLAVYTATFQNQTITETKPLFVFEKSRHNANAIFFPTSDISRGFWNDNSGNQNLLMYDDLNEQVRDDSDYVHSRGLGGNQVSDSFRINMTPNTGVTSEHQHNIMYTIGKDSAGGNEIKITVRLYEGTKLISEWIHQNVTQGFTGITSYAPPNIINNYYNLNLEFTAECTLCSDAKREAQVSWVQFRI